MGGSKNRSGRSSKPRTISVSIGESSRSNSSTSGLSTARMSRLVCSRLLRTEGCSTLASAVPLRTLARKWPVLVLCSTNLEMTTPISLIGNLLTNAVMICTSSPCDLADSRRFVPAEIAAPLTQVPAHDYRLPVHPPAASVHSSPAASPPPKPLWAQPFHVQSSPMISPPHTPVKERITPLNPHGSRVAPPSVTKRDPEIVLVCRFLYCGMFRFSLDYGCDGPFPNPELVRAQLLPPKSCFAIVSLKSNKPH